MEAELLSSSCFAAMDMYVEFLGGLEVTVLMTSRGLYLSKFGAGLCQIRSPRSS